MKCMIFLIRSSSRWFLYDVGLHKCLCMLYLMLRLLSTMYISLHSARACWRASIIANNCAQKMFGYLGSCYAMRVSIYVHIPGIWCSCMYHPLVWEGGEGG
jgi:hypothetical protein